MDEEQCLNSVRSYVYEQFGEEPTGHDYWHMERVANMAKQLAKKEGADPFIAEVGGWLHDVTDPKLVEDQEEALREQNRLLTSLIPSIDVIAHIETAMKDISFRGNHTVPETIEGKIIQDADRLDAIGAIGIARTFAYGGKVGQLIHRTDTKYDNGEEFNTTIQHFYDKLLRLKGFMNTESAKHIAQQRHELMENFLKQFYEEWNYIKK